MSRGPEEVNRLTESTYRVSGPGTLGAPGFEGGRCGDWGVGGRGFGGEEAGTVGTSGFEGGRLGRQGSRLGLCNPMDCSPPGSSVLEWHNKPTHHFLDFSRAHSYR